MPLEISAALSSLGNLINIAKTAVYAHDDLSAKRAIADMSDKLLLAYSAALGVTEKSASLQRLLEQANAELAEFKAKANERNRYQLAKVGHVGEFFAYRLRPAHELGDRQDEPAHFLCQPCFDADKKAVLQVGSYSALCPVCNTRTDVAQRLPLNPRPLANPWSGNDW